MQWLESLTLYLLVAYLPWFEQWHTLPLSVQVGWYIVYGLMGVAGALLFSLPVSPLLVWAYVSYLLIMGLSKLFAYSEPWRRATSVGMLAGSFMFTLAIALGELGNAALLISCAYIGWSGWVVYSVWWWASNPILPTTALPAALPVKPPKTTINIITVPMGGKSSGPRVNRFLT
jgi:hypothetical protein